jgi:RNA polymerase sigma-70 factor (ECF subfamily)
VPQDRNIVAGPGVLGISLHLFGAVAILSCETPYVLQVSSQSRAPATRPAGGTQLVDVPPNPAPGIGRTQSVAGTSALPASGEEMALIEGLRKGEESAFLELVRRHQSSLLRLAMLYVHNRAVAEEVVQETWLGVLQGIGGFEARSSVKTWVYRILLNRAKTRAARESRYVSVPSFEGDAGEAHEPAVDPSRFRGPNDPYPGHWATPPQSWGADPEKQLLAGEAREHLNRAIQALPASQREVITLRDIGQWTSDEVCDVLGISETNQRVLLHRARSRVRAALESYFSRV